MILRAIYQRTAASVLFLILAVVVLFAPNSVGGLLLTACEKAKAKA